MKLVKKKKKLFLNINFININFKYSKNQKVLYLLFTTNKP